MIDEVKRMDDSKIHEIGKEFYLLRSNEADFHRNICIKRFKDRNGTTRSMVFDPGTKLDLKDLIPALKKLIGGMDKLDYIFLSHQDPDVSSNSSMILSYAPNSRLITSIDTWRLVKMYGIPEKRFSAAENLQSSRLQITGTDQEIHFISAMYCHFRGAHMAYDPESGILFSGDVMGGLNTRKGAGISANEDSWKGIAQFHQIYMPSSLALRETIGRIGMMQNLPHTIAPQHGDIVEGQTVHDFMERLSRLKVGIDRLSERSPETEVLIMALNEFLDNIRALRPDLFTTLLQHLQNTKNFTTLFTIDSDTIIEIKVGAKEALHTFWELLKIVGKESDFKFITTSLRELLEYFGIYVPEHMRQKEDVGAPQNQ
jgi:glyoxylase-like metal-dependent hydrolase (beta-lactamase superfamily II)